MSVLIFYQQSAPPPAMPNVIFFHGAETLSDSGSVPAAPPNNISSGLQNGPAGESSDYYWANNQVQRGCEQNGTFFKSGSKSIRHRVIIPDDNEPGPDAPQVGKVLKFYHPATGLPGSQAIHDAGVAYLSNWFYMPTSGNAYASNDGGTGGNWQIFTNHFEWKPVNSGSIPPRVGAKVIFSIKWHTDHNPYWCLGGNDLKYVAPPTDISETSFAAGYFPGEDTVYEHPLDGGNPRGDVWVFKSFVVPFDVWFFLEVKLKMSLQNGAIQAWCGTQSSGLIELCNFSDANLNTLAELDLDTETVWSDNVDLYHSVGNYISHLHDNGTYDLYTDDHRIADGRVGPTLPEFS